MRLLKIQVELAGQDFEDNPGGVQEAVNHAVTRVRYYSDGFTGNYSCYVLDLNGNSMGEAEYIETDDDNERGRLMETPKRSGKGTHTEPVKYEQVKADDPKRQEKLKAQRDQFEADAGAGKVIDLTSLMISHGL